MKVCSSAGSEKSASDVASVANCSEKSVNVPESASASDAAKPKSDSPMTWNVRTQPFHWPKKRYACHEPWPDHLLLDIQKNPSDAYSVQQLVLWVDSATKEQAERRVRSVLLQFPDRDLIHEAFAKIYMKGGQGIPKDLIKAKEHLEAAIRLNPEEVEFHLLLKKACEALNDRKGVEAVTQTLFFLENPRALFLPLSKTFLASLTK